MFEDLNRGGECKESEEDAGKLKPEYAREFDERTPNGLAKTLPAAFYSRCFSSRLLDGAGRNSASRGAGLSCCGGGVGLRVRFGRGIGGSDQCLCCLACALAERSAKFDPIHAIQSTGQQPTDCGVLLKNAEAGVCIQRRVRSAKAPFSKYQFQDLTMKSLLFLIAGVAAGTAYVIARNQAKLTAKQQPIDQLAHKLQDAWADHHTVA